MKSTLTRLALALCLTGVSSTLPTQAQSPAPVPATGVRFPQIGETDARVWLTYLSSDLMQGRRVFTEGYGLAASYIADQLRVIGVKPLGDNGTYLQSISRRGYTITRGSSVTVDVNGAARTFRDSDHVSFPLLAGGRQTLSFKTVVYAGDGSIPNGAASAAFRDSLVVYSSPAPAGTPAGGRRGGSAATARSAALIHAGAAAVIALAPALPAPAAARRAGRGASPEAPAAPRPDVITMQKVDARIAPTIVADETFVDFLFSAAPTSVADARARVAKGETVSAVNLAGATVTIDVENAYQQVSLELTENVVGTVEGTDPTLKSTYVFFGAHLDHVGYSSGGEAPGRVNTPIDQDRIWNGADDDGSGSTALLAIAKAFVTGPKPKRSVVFVWHAGEEAGLVGSIYMAENPVVPLDRIQVELNIDMIGRNRDDDPAQQNTLYLIGADRISTDLHNLLVSMNSALPVPLTLDFEFNDAADPNSFYTRSDHYSYASKGIPIAFFFTGTHPDYHANTDTVDKILFPKLVRIAQYVYEAGFSLADTDRVLQRDNRGARSGRGFSGLLPRQ
ncbi:MAG: M28 family peptidase [Vicinamibacterales bacterium]